MRVLGTALLLATAAALKSPSAPSAERPGCSATERLEDRLAREALPLVPEADEAKALEALRRDGASPMID